MNKRELYTNVAKKAGVTIKSVTQICDALFDTMVEQVLSVNERVYINGFGVFNKKQYKQKTVGKIDSPGSTIEIPARTKMIFSPSRRLAEKFEEKTTTE